MNPITRRVIWRKASFEAGDWLKCPLILVDREIFRRFVHLEDRYDHLVDRFHNIYLTEAITEDDHAYELNMLLYLDGEYERRRFEQDKIEAKKDLGK